jgi:hypothetical protein
MPKLRRFSYFFCQLPKIYTSVKIGRNQYVLKAGKQSKNFNFSPAQDLLGAELANGVTRLACQPC